jgi:hypothetical protein
VYLVMGASEVAAASEKAAALVVARLARLVVVAMGVEAT